MKSACNSLKLAACAALAAALTAACATPGASNAPAAGPTPVQATTAQKPSEPETRASRIAAALAQAEAAYTADDKARLATLVVSLGASGIKPLDTDAPDTLAMWQSASGADTAPFRGRLLGPAYVRGELAPGEVWRSAQTFKSGVSSTLSVSHDGAGPVRMKVSDGKARAVCTPSAMKRPPCRFTPMFTQRYDIELTNEGDENAVYFLVFD